MAKILFKLRPELLVGGNIPEPLHGMAPRVVLGTNWWNKTRKEAYAKSHYRCVACGVHKLRAMYHQWLEGHEVYSINYSAGLMTYLETVALCHYCHNYVHDGRLAKLLESRAITHHKYCSIIRHGESVLKRNGLPTNLKQLYLMDVLALIKSGQVAPTHKWRLVIDGIKHKPIKVNHAQRPRG